MLVIVLEGMENRTFNSTFLFGTIFVPSLNQSMESGGVIAPDALHVSFKVLPRSTCSVPVNVIPENNNYKTARHNRKILVFLTK